MAAAAAAAAWVCPFGGNAGPAEDGPVDTDNIRTLEANAAVRGQYPQALAYEAAFHEPGSSRADEARRQSARLGPEPASKHRPTRSESSQGVLARPL